MARKPKKGDSAYNARRREIRSAQRYLRKANKSSGATRERYRLLAREHFENALNTYDPSTKQKFSAPIKRVAAELGADIEQRRDEFITATPQKQEQIIKRYERNKAKLESASFESLETNLKDEQFRLKKETEIIMSSVVGKRILAGLVDVWGEYAGDREKITQAIFQYLNVNSWSDVIKKIEDSLKATLYKISGEDDFYDTVKTLIQTKVVDNTLIA